MNAGSFLQTLVILNRTFASTKDDFGHRDFQWKRSGYAAAKLFQNNSTEQANRPSETSSTSVRLLCRAVNLDTTQRIQWKNKTWRITAAETRDVWDTLITVEPIQET